MANSTAAFFALGMLLTIVIFLTQLVPYLEKSEHTLADDVYLGISGAAVLICAVYGFLS